ncbi:MAG: sigma-70 family RNA polymerase sigma factor [Bryobacteraceae bacterium]
MGDPGSGTGVLLSRCQRDPSDAAAWEQLLRVIWPMLKQVAGRVMRQWGISGDEQRLDLCQEVCLKLSQSVRSIPAAVLQTDSAAEAYLRALAANAARDVLRAQYAKKRGEFATVALEDRLPVLASDLGVEQQERAMLLGQVDTLLEGTARDRAVFWLYYRQGLTAKEISMIPWVGLTIKGVESLLHRMTEGVRARMAPKWKAAQAPEAGD